MESRQKKSHKQVVAENMRHFLAERNITQKEAAEAAGVSTSTLSNWANGKTDPRESNLQRLADAYDISLSVLWEDHSVYGAKAMERRNTKPASPGDAFTEEPVSELLPGSNDSMRPFRLLKKLLKEGCEEEAVAMLEEMCHQFLNKGEENS